ncbi:TPA: hypothetical protein JA342_06455, partial [Legionella pneumophila]|nr:hypothetical protein [Legionella pneumophila]
QQAAYWFGKSAHQGNPIGQAKLGYMYLAGLGVNKSLVKAYAWLKIAAENKNEEAAKQLKSLEAKLTEPEKLEAEKMIKDLGPLESKENYED